MEPEAQSELDATGLDRIGIPIAQAVRPLGRSWSVSQGKGLAKFIQVLSK